MEIEKPALKSKKFWAFLLCIILLGALAITALITQTIGWPLSLFMVILAVTIGFLGTGYIFSTAQLDKYVRLAQITGKGLSDKEDGE